MSDIAIKIENITKEYRLGAIGGTTLREEISRFTDKLFHRIPVNPEHGKKFMALQGVNLEVRKGEALGIIGRNGAGKSTLLKLISRVTGPSSGTISYNGRITSMLEVGTGFHGELTGRENIYMNGAILGMTKREIDRKIDAIIDFAEMQQFIDTPVKRYSSGMYVKLAFSVAAHLDSEIMIMDEVLAVGDSVFQQKCLERMRLCASQEGRTILYVSHNLNTIQYLCNRAILMDHGKIIYDALPDEVIAEYTKKDEDLTQTSRQVLNLPRPEWARNGHARFISLEIINAPKCRLESDSKMELRVHWIALQDVVNLVMRIYLKHKSNIRVGMASIGLGSAKKNEEHTETFSVDYSNVLDGSYYLSFEMHTMVIPGSEPICQDSISNQFLIEIKDNGKLAVSVQDKDYPDYTDTIPWRHANWGAMRFPMTRIC